jgi:hypothetical protein
MPKQMRVGVKAAWIGGSFLIVAAVIAGLFTYFNNKDADEAIQNIEKQNVDSGSINNYNPGRDLKIENNTYNNKAKAYFIKTESSKESPKPIITYKGKPVQKLDTPTIEAKNQIVNNASNLGIQMNENKGIIIAPEDIQIPIEENYQITPYLNEDKKEGFMVSPKIGSWKTSFVAIPIQEDSLAKPFIGHGAGSWVLKSGRGELIYRNKIFYVKYHYVTSNPTIPGMQLYITFYGKNPTFFFFGDLSDERKMYLYQ